MVHPGVFHLLMEIRDDGPRWLRMSSGAQTWALWDGLPPLPLPEPVHGIADIDLQGEVDGNRVYGERVPQGLPLDRVVPPPELEDVIHGLVVEGLASLHALGRIHGQVTRDRVFLGRGGEVILVGRGRSGGRPAMDIEAASQLFERTALSDSEVTAPCGLTPSVKERARLAQWVCDLAPPEPVGTPIVIALGAYPSAGMDEIIPDLGPDSGQGLLDPWALSDSGWEMTAERTDVGIVEADHALLLELWSRVAAGSHERAPEDRFSAVAGQPSRGIRSLLQKEQLHSLPMNPGPHPDLLSRFESDDGAESTQSLEHPPGTQNLILQMALILVGLIIALGIVGVLVLTLSFFI